MPSKKRSKHNVDSTTDQYKFFKDERVLVLPKQHADDIYEAKILERKLDSKSKEALYKIHYKGWNKRWDEWVDARRLLKINPSNLQIMKNKKQQQQQQLNNNEDDQDENKNNEYNEDKNKNNKNVNRKKRKIKSSTTNNKKRKLNHHENENENDNKSDKSKKKHRKTANGIENALELKLPTNLKRALITDWENITKKSQLIQLPRNQGHRISDILNDFESFAIKQGQDKNIVTEISRGIKDYFNQALKVTLLYKLERNQYNNISMKYKHLSMDQIYGVEHLCRLFVKLPQLLSPSDLDEDTKQILRQQIEFIIQFVMQNKDRYFNTSYN